MPELRKVPIFSAGKWNGLEFTEADLDDMVENFNTLKGVHKIPLKLGHNDDQPLTDGQPALGWVDNLRRQGEKLIADFTDVPRVLRDAIKARRFRTVSIELLMGVKRGDSVLRHVLDAVAVLGADQPAVNNLGDLDQFLATRSMQFDDAGHRISFESIAGKLPLNGDKQMNEEEIQALVNAAVAKFTKTFESQIETKDAEIQRLEGELEKAKADKRELDDLRTFKVEAEKRTLVDKREMAKQILEDAVKADVILPAQRERFVGMYGIDDDKRLLALDLAEFRKDFAKTGDSDASSSTGFHKKDDRRATTNPREEMDRLVKDYQADHPDVGYVDALTFVAQKNPELHRDYMSYKPEEA